MFAIYTHTPGCERRRLENHLAFASLDVAEEYVRTAFAKILVAFERDPDAEAADFFTSIGGIYAVEAI